MSPLEVARNKEWKLKKLTQLVVSSLYGVSEMMQTESMQSLVPEEVHPVNVVLVASQVVPPVVTTLM